VAELTPLLSELRSVQDFESLLRSFVQSLPSKIEAIQSAMQTRPDVAAQLLHKLHGSAGGYGYPMISRVVADLEKKVKAGTSASDLQTDVAALEELVHRAQLGLDPSRDTQGF